MSDPTPLSDEYFAHWAAFYDGEYPDGEHLRKVAADALRWAAERAGVTTHHPDGTITSSRERIRAEADRVEGSK